MARTLMMSLVLVNLLVNISISATPTSATVCPTVCGSKHIPEVSPCWRWGSDFCPQDVIPIVYGQNRNQSYTCTATKFDPDTRFNLAEPIDCGTRLSQDLYGWGVRVGFYANWIASLFANVLLPEEIRSTIDANAIFLFALEVSALRASLPSGQAMKVDALIFYLVGIGTAVGALSLWGRRTRFYHTNDVKTTDIKSEFGGVGTYIRLALSIAVGIYGIWFWFSPFRIGVLVVGNCDPRCAGAYIFGLPLQTGVRWLFFTFTLVCEIYWIVTLLLLIVCSVPRIRAVWRSIDMRMHDSLLRLYHRSPLSKLFAEYSTTLFPFCNLLWYIFIMALIEVTLHQNQSLDTLVSAKTSSSPAQLIPMLIGCITLVRLLWVYFTDGYKEKIGDLHPFIAYQDVRAQSDSSQLVPVSARKNPA